MDSEIKIIYIRFLEIVQKNYSILGLKAKEKKGPCHKLEFSFSSQLFEKLKLQILHLLKKKTCFIYLPLLSLLLWNLKPNLISLKKANVEGNEKHNKAY